jgi:hypothetical protein
LAGPLRFLNAGVLGWDRDSAGSGDIMRALAPILVLGVSLLAAACSDAHKAPVGRWEGTYETADTMLAARLETAADGTVRVSAPDALGIETSDDSERAAIRQKLSEGLAAGWDAVEPRPMDFDGTIFRKPGGVAPQIQWNPRTNAMVLVVYFGTAPSIRIPLRPVKQFSDNPWPE